MGLILAALAWTVLVVSIMIQLVFNKIVNSIPTAHLLGWGPAVVGFFSIFEVGFDLFVGVIATVLTVLAFYQRSRNSGRQIQGSRRVGQ